MRGSPRLPPPSDLQRRVLDDRCDNPALQAFAGEGQLRPSALLGRKAPFDRACAEAPVTRRHLRPAELLPCEIEHGLVAVFPDAPVDQDPAGQR